MFQLTLQPIGTIGTNTATIVNKFAFPIEGARVRFVVPKGYSYTVTNGIVSQEFDGTTVHVVDVSFDVNANSSKTIFIAVEATALNDVKLEKDLSIYPNPYKQGKLKIDLNGFSDNAIVTIKNMLGQTVYQEQHFTSTAAEIIFSEKMSKAVYLIIVESGDKKAIKKLIVE